MSSAPPPPPPPPYPPAPPKSVFVTALAWVFIAISGFGTFISILQNVMVALVFPHEHLREALAAPGSESMPAYFRLLFSNIQVFFLLFLVVLATTLIASIGLLKRRNWGRIVFIGVMVLGILWNVAAVAFQYALFPSGFQAPDGDPALRTMMVVIRVATALFALALSILWAWIIKRLTSPEIRAEFGAP